jgi:hypothetical protein
VGRAVSATAAALILIALLCAALPRCAQAQPPEWRTVRANRVVAHYPRSMPEAQIEALLTACGKARESVEKWFGSELRERLEMRVYPDTPSYVSTTGAPWWHSAVWTGGMLHIQPPQILAERGALLTALTHEYTHMALEQSVKLQLPLWFEEGLSGLISKEFEDLVKNKEHEHVWRGTLKELCLALTQKQKPARAQSAYIGAYLLMREMESQFSSAVILAFLKDLKKDSVFEAKFEQRFKASPENALKSLQKKYPHSKKKS